MSQRAHFPHADRNAQVLKACPWCGGGLVFTPYFPVVQLAPGASRRLPEENIPAPLRYVPAWTCGTPHCLYREPA